MSNKNQVYACIDLGSNMCRMLVASPNPHRPLGFRILKTCSNLVSLGKNSNVIDHKGIHRIIDVLRKCMEILKEYKTPIIYCVATAIFRSASNAQEVIDLIYQTYGLNFRIADPGEEVMFSAVGCRDILLEGTSFLMDMGGGSTELGFFTKNRDKIDILDWISVPYGLFYFGNSLAKNRPIPTDAHKALMNFIETKKSTLKQKISITICRSGIMSIISNYICKRSNIEKDIIHGRIFETGYIIRAINSIMEMGDMQIIQERLISNTSHLSSTRGTLEFTKDVLKQLPVNFVILGNCGVKEGMMSMACLNS